MKKIIAIFALLLLCVGCSAEEAPVYVTASNVKSKVQVSEIDGLEFDWQTPAGESAPHCVITNSTNTDYFTGYATLEVYANGGAPTHTKASACTFTLHKPSLFCSAR